MSASEDRVADLLNTARSQMESGDRDQALLTLQKALDIDPANAEVREGIRSIEREIAAMKVFKRSRSMRAHAAEEVTSGADSTGFVDECIRRSQEAMDAGDEIRALQELERARRQDSENEEINRRIRAIKRHIKANNLADLGFTRLRSGDPAGAIEQAWNIFNFWPLAPGLAKLVAELEKIQAPDQSAAAVPAEDEYAEVEEAFDLDGEDLIEAPEAEEPVPMEAEAPDGAGQCIASIRERISASDYAAAFEEAESARNMYPGDSTIMELYEKLSRVVAPVGVEAEAVAEPAPPARERVAVVQPAETRVQAVRRPAESGTEQRKNPVLMIVVGVIALTVIVLGLLAILKPRRPALPDAPPLQPYSIAISVNGPEDMSITLDGVAMSRDSTGRFIAAGGDFGAKQLEIRAQGYEVYSRSLDVQQGFSMNETIDLDSLGTNTTRVRFSLLMPQGDPQPAPGEVTFLVDGVETDSASVNLPTGPHVFQAVLRGYNSLPESVLVDTPGGFDQSLALLSSQTSQISLTLAGDVEGNAVFIVDGVQVGTGRRVTHIADRGQHTLLIRMEGHEDWSRSITLGADGFSQTVSPVEITTTGRLLIGPEPWADVSIDGRSYGQTPLPPIELEPGTYSVTLTNPDYEDQTSSVTISLGEDTMIRYTAAERRQQPEVIEEQPVLPPFAISQTAPVIPGMARQRGDIHGYVTLDVQVGTDGSVTGVTVTNDPLGLGCGQAAADAVRQWRFQPATQGGRPVEVSTTVQVRFDID